MGVGSSGLKISRSYLKRVEIEDSELQMSVSGWDWMGVAGSMV